MVGSPYANVTRANALRDDEPVPALQPPGAIRVHENRHDRHVRPLRRDQRARLEPQRRALRSVGRDRDDDAAFELLDHRQQCARPAARGRAAHRRVPPRREHSRDQLPVAMLAHEHRDVLVAVLPGDRQQRRMPEREHPRLPLGAQPPRAPPRCARERASSARAVPMTKRPIGSRITRTRQSTPRLARRPHAAGSLTARAPTPSPPRARPRPARRASRAPRRVPRASCRRSGDRGSNSGRERIRDAHRLERILHELLRHFASRDDVQQADEGNLHDALRDGVVQRAGAVHDRARAARHGGLERRRAALAQRDVGGAEDVEARGAHELVRHARRDRAAPRRGARRPRAGPAGAVSSSRGDGEEIRRAAA